jgi:PIN domain nuclease of toxin-antitoxin system
LNYVLDACAMIAYLNGETGGDVVDRLLRDSSNSCWAHSINLCEVYYDVIRAAGEANAEQAMSDLAAAGVQDRGDLDATFWRDVGKLKARGRISLADGCCVVLAQRLVAHAVTSDHREFDPLDAAGICPILFIR